MLDKQIERQEVNLVKYTALLDDEVKTLQRFVSAISDKGFLSDAKSGLTLSTQVHNVISTISSIGRVIDRYESEIFKHQEILTELKLAKNELVNI